MANENVFHSILDDVYAIGEQIQQRVSEEANRLLPDVKEKIYREFGEYQQFLVEKLFREAVDEFYAAYSPAYYGRNYSLYNALEFDPDQYGIIDDQIDSNSLFNSSHLTAFRNGDQDGLYNLVFVGGWHGGAAGTDYNGETRTVPTYRVPYDSYYRWGRTAVNTASPNFLAMNKIRGASGTMDNEFETISRKHIDVFAKQITDVANKIADELLSDWR